MSNNKDLEKEAVRERMKGYNPDEIIVIPATPIKSVYDTKTHLRVCAYCRVSTGDIRQTTSYELQKQHYEELIAKNENWQMVGIYADEGISGTSLEHRDELLRLLKDCEAGKIDLILTKSVSRLARNVVDCISIVRKLKSLKNPVRVMFETEGIDTFTSTGEMQLSLLATFAQQESQTKSDIMNWSIDTRFKKGIPLTPALFGFNRDKTQSQQLVINDDEAEIVRLMYAMIVTGYKLTDIVEVLNKLEFKTKRGNEWSTSSVYQILVNERNCGEVYERKSFTESFITHKKRVNNGERASYILQNHHDAIIPKEIYVLTLKLLNFRNYQHAVNYGMNNLSVISSGALRGFVAVNRTWPFFTIEDYVESSNKAYYDANGDYIEAEEDEIEITKNDISDLDLSGYQSVTSQFFSDRQLSLMWINNREIFFSKKCFIKMNEVEYVQILFHPEKNLLAIRPTDSEDPYGVKWVGGKNKSTKKRSCPSFTRILYQHLGWNSDFKYKFIGVGRSKDNQEIMIFDLSNPKISFRESNIEEMHVLNNQTKPKEIILYPKKLVESFGDDYYSGEMNNQLRLIDLFGLWDVYSKEQVAEAQTEWIALARTIVDKYITQINEMEVDDNE